MNKPVRVILLDEADSEYKRLNEVVGQQTKEGKENTEEMQLLRSIKQKVELIKANPFYGDNIETTKFHLYFISGLAGIFAVVGILCAQKLPVISGILSVKNH